MKKIGIVGSDNSHAITLTQCINIPNQVTGEYNFPEWRVTHLFGLEKERTEEVARQVKIPNIVSSPEDMIGEVDAVIVVFRHGDLHYEYSMPFIKAGIPIWVDKPFTIKVNEAQELIDTAEKCGTLLVGGSIIPALPGVGDIRDSIKSGKVGKLQTGSASYAVELENIFGGLPFYGAHVVETALTIFGCNANSVLACQSEGIVTAIVKYDSIQITINFIEHNKNVLVTAFGDKGTIMTQVEGDPKYEGVKRFIEILEGKRERQTKEELLTPVVLLAAIVESLKTGREVFLKDMK